MSENHEKEQSPNKQPWDDLPQKGETNPRTGKPYASTARARYARLLSYEKRERPKRRTPGIIYAVRKKDCPKRLYKVGYSKGRVMPNGELARAYTVRSMGYPTKAAAGYEKHEFCEPGDELVCDMAKPVRAGILTERVTHALLGMMPWAKFIHKDGLLVKVRGPRKEEFLELTTKSLDEIKHAVERAKRFVDGEEEALTEEEKARLLAPRCSKCTNPPEGDKTLCRSCLDKVARRERKKRAKSREAGVCDSSGCSKKAIRGKKCLGCWKRQGDLQRQRMANRREKGICSHCGSVALPGRAQCASCSAKGIAEKANKKTNRIGAGLCIDCGKCPPEGDTLQCKDCKAKKKKTQQEIAARRASEGVCTSCGAPVDRPGLKSCNRCIQEGSDRTIKNRRVLQQSRKEAGLCPNCGAQRDKPSTLYCRRCLDQAKLRADNKKARGICIRCGDKPAQEGKTLCQGCRKKQADASQKYRERKKAGLSRPSAPPLPK